jgi:hypothetical protein
VGPVDRLQLAAGQVRRWIGLGIGFEAANVDHPAHPPASWFFNEVEQYDRGDQGDR